jgi:hypothetical protein
MARTTRMPSPIASPIAIVAISLPRNVRISSVTIVQDNQTSHRAKVPAQAMASMTTKGTGISSITPECLKIVRAASASPTPNNAQIIQDGKYEPRMLREGAPSQPLNRPGIEQPYHHRVAGTQPRNDSDRCGGPSAIAMALKSHRFAWRQQPPLWGSGRASSPEKGSRPSIIVL